MNIKRLCLLSLLLVAFALVSESPTQATPRPDPSSTRSGGSDRTIADPTADPITDQSGSGLGISDPSGDPGNDSIAEGEIDSVDSRSVSASDSTVTGHTLSQGAGFWTRGDSCLA
jgi:hypothetical protein